MRIALFFALALATGAAFAQESPSSDPGPISTDRADKAGTSVGDRPPFDDLDTHHDGFLSRFARWDEDGDERLSLAEYDASAIVDAE